MVNVTSYNETALKAVENTFDIVKYANDVTGGVFIAFGVIIFFFVLMGALFSIEFEARLIVSSFACFFISVLLAGIELLNWIYPLGFLLLVALSGLFIVFAHRGR